MLEQDHGLELPRRLQIEFSKIVQAMSERTGGEVNSASIRKAFDEAFIGATSPLSFNNHTTVSVDDDDNLRQLTANISYQGQERDIDGKGNGPIDAFVDALKAHFQVDFRVVDYHQHTTGSGADAQSACYIEIQAGKGATRYGASLHSNIVSASLLALCSAFNRAVSDGLLEPTV